MHTVTERQANALQAVKHHIARANENYADARTETSRAITAGAPFDSYLIKPMVAAEAAHLLWDNVRRHAEYLIKNDQAAELTAYHEATHSQTEKARDLLIQTETNSTCAFTRARDTEIRNAQRHFLRQAEPAIKLLAAN
ncbi:hypothetical protein [Streptomyces sp. NPDC057557]|uniref:hypothetical protein n=1 Tax=Streptomyces sp. NPDC057557 TaxID=3346167 RepID=UPI0036B636C5